MTRNQIITAIDWGTTKVSVLVAKIDYARGPLILGVNAGPSGGSNRGDVEDAKETRQALADVIFRAEQSSGVKIEDALVTLTGGYISSSNTQATLKMGQGEAVVTSSEVLRLMEMVSQSPSGENNRVLQVIPRGYVLDQWKNVRDPLGMRCTEIQLNAHVVMGTRWKIRSINNMLQALQIKPLGIVAAPIASAECVLSSADKEIGVALVEIGSGVTNVVIYREGAPIQTFPIPVGGFNFTNDLALGFGLPYQAADQIKMRCGHANAGIVPRDQMLALSDLGFDDLRKVPYREVCDILRERAVEFYRLLIYRLRESSLSTRIPAGVVLTGGSANLPGLDSLGREMLNLPVRVGVPEAIPGLPRALQVPGYAAAVGLLYWGIARSEDGTRVEELRGLNGHHSSPSIQTSMHSMVERVSGWVTEVAARSKR